jgi:hypothetical protein
MKKAISVIVIFLGLFNAIVIAQELNVSWTEKQLYENKKDGFFDEFVGSNSEYVYGKFSDLTITNRFKKKGESIKKLKLTAYDKSTMEKEGDVIVLDMKNKTLAAKYEGLKYYKTIVLEKVIYIFWIKEGKSKSGKESKIRQDLYVQSFDSKLSPQNSLKKVYEMSSGSKDAKKADIFVMGNKKVSNGQIVIGGERAASIGKGVVFEYKVLNSDFSFASANQVTLPVTVNGKSSGLTSNYQLGDDGNLHVITYVQMDKEERKTLKKGESSSYPIYSVVDLASGKLQSYPVKFDNKNVSGFDFIVTENSIKIFGFFCDLQKDPRGNDTHGILYAILDPKTFELKGNINFSYFTKAQLSELFANDNDGKDRKGLFASKKKKDSEDESLASSYIIEDVQSVDKDNLVLFCSIMRNYSVTTCDSKGNCTTRYYCEKSNVTAFKLNNLGEIVWASNLDRKITYNNWDIYDLKVIYKDDKFFVTYGSAFALNAKKKNGRSSKSSKYMADRFEYAIFDYKSGKYNKTEYKVNAVNAKKKDKKHISATQIQVLDNQFYTQDTRIGYKAWPFFVFCPLSFACPLLIYVPLYNPNFRKGDGYLGHMEVIK